VIKSIQNLSEKDGFFKMEKKDYLDILGLISFIVGIILLLSHVRVGSFWYFGARAGWIFLLMGIDFVLIILKPNKICYIVMIILAIILFIAIIMNLRVYLIGMSLFKFIGIFILIFGGIGLVLKSKMMQ
jgi:hypothetical protein